MKKNVILFIFFSQLLLQDVYSQNYKFSVQMQYSFYEDEFSKTSSEKVIFLGNNENNNMMRLIIKNDTIQRIGLYDSKRKKAYLSDDKLLLNSDFVSNLSKIYFKTFQYVDYSYSKKNITIQTNKIENGTKINVKKIEKQKINKLNSEYDLHIRTSIYPNFTNTQAIMLGYICGKKHQLFKWINKEVIVESFFIKNSIKTEIYKLDKIESTNFEIDM